MSYPGVPSHHRQLESLVGAVLAAEVVEKTSGVLGSLRLREARSLRMRFGIGEKREHALAKVVQVFGATRDRIRPLRRRP